MILILPDRVERTFVEQVFDRAGVRRKVANRDRIRSFAKMPGYGEIHPVGGEKNCSAPGARFTR